MYVARAVSACLDGEGSGGTGATSGAWAAHDGGAVPVVIQVCTALAAHEEKSASTGSWPTLGTTTRWPCGNWATTACAPTVGVRRSRPPLIASIGTSGSGPVPSGASPVGPGHAVQRGALPNPAAQEPNGPNVPGDVAATACCSSAGRWAGGVAAAHGKGPSAQTVAA